jgi:tetratricopeptide (TPR) repeat protein
VYLYRREYQAAREAMERAIAIQPEAWFYRVLGFIYERTGMMDAAVAALERSVALDPDDYEARAGLARVYRATGREEDAAAQLAAGHTLAAAADEGGRACFESVLWYDARINVDAKGWPYVKDQRPPRSIVPPTCQYLCRRRSGTAPRKRRRTLGARRADAA